MSSLDVKGDLHGYLRDARETLVWKLDGLGEYDIRRPLTPTGTNLLGLVKHSAGTHLRYFGDAFGRNHHTSLPWMSDDAEPNADMWAKPDETREDIVALYRSTWELADATITELPLDAIERPPWWVATPPAPSTMSSYLSHPRPNATLATPTSSASSSTAQPASSMDTTARA